MKKLLIAAAAASAAIVPQAAFAQAVPAAQIAVVNLERLYRECTACKAANTQLQSQGTGFQTRRQQLTTQLQTEAQSLQTAVGALAGKQPDAALQARIQAFQTKQQQAEQELGNREQQIQRNRAHVLQQINARLDPILTSVMARRGANVMIDAGQTLKSNPSLDVTNEVLAQLNTALPSVSVNAPAQAQTTPPQGR